MREDPNDVYDRIRCRTCGCEWIYHPDDVLIRGRSEPLVCARHRPPTTPPWVGEALARHELAATASNLPPTASDAEIARREVAGGVPTREWPEAAGIPPGEFLSAVMARSNARNGEDA
jgi:hypothetical protein